ncbi:MAG: hypothetical protein V1855_05115, partial [bacterium]
ENDRIRDLYSIIQQAAGQVFDANTKNAFAQTLVNVFNDAQTVQTYIVQLLEVAAKTSLLNDGQQDYVTNTMLPMVAPEKVETIKKSTEKVRKQKKAAAKKTKKVKKAGKLKIPKAKKTKKKKTK